MHIKYKHPISVQESSNSQLFFPKPPIESVVKRLLNMLVDVVMETSKYKQVENVPANSEVYPRQSLRDQGDHKQGSHSASIMADDILWDSKLPFVSILLQILGIE